jgi:hypothetical protein
MIVPRVWPKDTREELDAYYGPHVPREGGYPTLAWEAKNLVWIKPPYHMRAAWDQKLVITRIRCHRRVAASLSAILDEMRSRFGRAGLNRRWMNLFGGTYVYRVVRGSNRLSLHAYGAAIDLDPIHNPLGKAWKLESTMMDLEVVDIFESAGWTWGGRFEGRKDCMHFQAAG